MEAEGGRSPELAQIFFASGPDQLFGRLTSALEDAVQRGEIFCADIRLTAEQFIAAARGELHMRVIIGAAELPAVETIRAHVRNAVTIFATALRAGSGSAASA